MYLKIIHALKGVVQVQLTGFSPERFFNPENHSQSSHCLRIPNTVIPLPQKITHCNPLPQKIT